MEIPSLSALQSWKIRHCGHWSCSSSVDGVCAHPCSPACCPRGHFLQQCMGVQQHCLPCAVGCAQKTWHSAENLTLCLCAWFWALWSSDQVLLASFEVRTGGQRCRAWVEAEPRLVGRVKDVWEECQLWQNIRKRWELAPLQCSVLLVPDSSPESHLDKESTHKSHN